jgi:hypothetical protein
MIIMIMMSKYWVDGGLDIRVNINVRVAVNAVMVVMVAIFYMLHFCQIKNTVRTWNRWRAAMPVELI